MIRLLLNIWFQQKQFPSIKAVCLIFSDVLQNFSWECGVWEILQAHLYGQELFDYKKHLKQNRTLPFKYLYTSDKEKEQQWVYSTWVSVETKASFILQCPMHIFLVASFTLTLDLTLCYIKSSTTQCRAVQLELIEQVNGFPWHGLVGLHGYWCNAWSS